MSVTRRFVLASSLARLLEREGGPADRLVEAYFPARSDRTQLVRVERGRASLILRSSAPEGQVSEEAVEVPLSHAEALVEAAAGTVAFDRTAVALSQSAEAMLDRFIMPQGLDLLTVTITGDPRTFAPPLWLGPEVTDDPAFEARELAISGLPAVEEVEVTSAALESLLDTLGSLGAYRLHAQPQRANHRNQGAIDPGSAEVPSPGQDGVEPAPGGVSAKGEDEALQHALETLPTTAAETDSSFVDEGTGSRLDEANSGVEEGDQQGQYDPSAALPNVAVGPAPDEVKPTEQRRPMLRTNVTELDEGIARLARSLAPRRPRSEH